MFHLIELVRLRNQESFAYHFASSNIYDLKNKHSHLFDTFSNYEISTHVLTTDSNDWSSVVDLDPYFKDVKCFENMNEFGNNLKKQTQISSSDMCSYILNSLRKKFHTDDITYKKMEKVLYYVYSDFLEKTKKSLFPEKFAAWAYGPVESYSRHARMDGNLPKSDYVMDKILASDDMNNILSITNDVIDKYGSKSTNQLINMTHRKGSPWQRRYVRGMNETITDDDILKYHHVETE